MKHLPVNLLLLRIARGLTQAQLADILSATYNYEVCQSTICRIESGRFEPRITLLTHLADFFGVSLEALLQAPAAAKASV